MNYLLDTHVLLWWLDDASVLSKKAYEILSDGNNVIFISAASVWEIRIKESVGKLVLPKNFRKVLLNQSFEFLPVTVEHAHEVSLLPMIHRDPFDRMLVSQAMLEKCTLITRDSLLKKYKISIVDA